MTYNSVSTGTDRTLEVNHHPGGVNLTITGVRVQGPQSNVLGISISTDDLIRLIAELQTHLPKPKTQLEQYLEFEPGARLVRPEASGEMIKINDLLYYSVIGGEVRAVSYLKASGFDTVTTTLIRKD